MDTSTLIHTIRGLIPAGELQVIDIITTTENSREIATEWRKDGEIVRRDVWVSLLRGLSIGSEQGSI
jgi:hypothetical protein